jgi:hypothetical protein
MFPSTLIVPLRAAFCFELLCPVVIFCSCAKRDLILGEPHPSCVGSFFCIESIHNSKSKYMVYGISEATVAAICVCGCRAISIRKSRRLFPDGPMSIAAPRLDNME